MSPPGGTPYYSMTEVLRCVDAAPQRLGFRPEALRDAREHYGYGREDIADVLRGLDQAQWHKTLALASYRGEAADVYRVELPDDMGKAYVKFFIDMDNVLQVLSFKPRLS